MESLIAAIRNKYCALLQFASVNEFKILPLLAIKPIVVLAVSNVLNINCVKLLTMYSWYERVVDANGKLRLVFEEQTSLGGCNNGVIAIELKKILPRDANPYVGWTLPIAEKWNSKGYSFVIDIKPNAGEIFLCELDKVIGYSYDGWTPIMLRLKVIRSGLDLGALDKTDFECPDDSEMEVIYTILYVMGSFRDGQLTGTWVPPYGKITATLFWPEAMTYFFEQVKLMDPDFLQADIKTLTLL